MERNPFYGGGKGNHDEVPCGWGKSELDFQSRSKPRALAAWYIAGLHLALRLEPNMTSLCRLVTTLVVLASFASPLFAADAWRAGAAKAIITPEKPMWMAGYASRDHVAEGKSIDLMGKALVLEDPSGERAVLITLDLVGIDRPLSQSICTQLEKKYGLLRDQVAINCSHTHSGPVVARNLRPMHYLMLSEDQKKQV